eukprot:1709160-Amphidinium_carterae.1
MNCSNVQRSSVIAINRSSKMWNKILRENITCDYHTTVEHHSIAWMTLHVEAINAGLLARRMHKTQSIGKGANVQARALSLRL